MNNNFRKNKVFFLIFLILILGASFVFAAKLETNFPTIAGQKPDIKTTFPEAVIYLFNLSLFVGTMIVLVILVYSGYRYITSRNNPAVVGDIKKKIYSAFLGLLILISSYIILRTINPQLVILSLPQLSPSPPSSPVQPPESKQNVVTFQEIPLGTIIEHILAGNVSVAAGSSLKCYEYDSEGNTVDQEIDGKKDGKIDEKDSKNYNTFYCVKLLSAAFQIKTNKIINKTNELRALLNGCSCSSCKTYPLAIVSYGCITKAYPSSNNCQSCCQTTYGCDSNCSCCGSPGGKDKGCPGTDPCSNRKAINCKRQEIKQLIDGKELVEKDVDPCPDSYNPDLDPKKNPKVLTLEEAKSRIDDFAKDFINDLNNLKEAEQFMKDSNNGEGLTMAEFFELKVTSQRTIERVGFKNYDASDYCQEFNCRVKNKQTNDCISCGINDKTNRMCAVAEEEKDETAAKDEKKEEKITEYYMHSGDSATFYFNKEYKEENITKGEKCMIDPTEEKKIQVGLIPIGEAVDETEKFAEKFAALYDLLITSYQKVIDLALNLNDSPNNCNCGVNCTNKADCHASGCPPCSGNTGCYNQNYACSGCTNCEPGQAKRDPKNPKQSLTKKEPLDCSCVKNFKDWPYRLVPIAESSEYVCPICEFNYYLKKISNTGINKDDFPCCEYYTEKNAQNVEILKAKIKNLSKEDEEQKAKNEYGFCNERLDSLPGYAQIIDNVIEKMDNLMNAKKLEEGDINKCPILEKLTLSRERLQKCVKGFGLAKKEGLTETRVLRCSKAWDLIRLGDLVILPRFPNPKADSYLNCYPYNSKDLTEKEKLQCYPNIHTQECASSTRDILDNYYCCRVGQYE